MVRKSLMDIVTLSGIRRELLFYLEEGPKSLSEIRDRFEITSPEVSPRIKELIEHGFVRFEGRKYHLTPIGKTIVKNFSPFVSTINVFDQYPDFWDEHDISSIPEEMLYRIGELKNYSIIEDDTDNDGRTSKEMLNIMYGSSGFKGISCTFNDDYPELVVNLANQGKTIDLMLTDKVYNILNKKFPEHINQFLSIGNSRLYVSKEDIKISYFVTDQCLFFSMCYKNGKFDLHSNLVSNDPSSLQWGVDLFDYYRLRAEKIC